MLCDNQLFPTLHSKNNTSKVTKPWSRTTVFTTQWNLLCEVPVGCRERGCSSIGLSWAPGNFCSSLEHLLPPCHIDLSACRDVSHTFLSPTPLSHTVTQCFSCLVLMTLPQLSPAVGPLEQAETRCVWHRAVPAMPDRGTLQASPPCCQRQSTSTPCRYGQSWCLLENSQKEVNKFYTTSLHFNVPNIDIAEIVSVLFSVTICEKQKQVCTYLRWKYL